MVFFYKHCITQKNYKRAKKRLLNCTKKNYSSMSKQIKKDPMKFLTIKELYNDSCHGNNDIMRHVKRFRKNHSLYDNQYKKHINEIKKLRHECIQKIGNPAVESMIKHLDNAIIPKIQEEIIDLDMDSVLYKNMGEQYNNYKIFSYCKHFNVLDIDKLSKHFDYLDVRSFSHNPSKTCYSFCIDFIGNRNYYFFVKDVYGNRVKHIPLHKNGETFVSIHKTLQEHLFRRHSTDNYLWLDDESIIYIAHNKYYNTNICYSYNVSNHKRKVIYNEEQHRDLTLLSTISGYYMILLSSTYHSDEVYIIDIDDHKKQHYKVAKCIEKPVLKDKSFVQYPYINHIDAEWYILKNDKGVYTFMKTMDFKSFKILFTKRTKCFSIYDVYFMNDTFVFLYRIKSASAIMLYTICEQELVYVKRNSLCDKIKSCHFEVMNFIPQENKLFFYSSSFTRQPRLFALYIDRIHNHAIEEIKQKYPNTKKNIITNKYNEKVVSLKNNSIQITIIYKKGTVLKNRKCLLYGYGSYGDHFDSVFNPNKLLSLCDKGFVVIISQISGDGTLGFKQRENGMFLNKKNTFHDFIYIIEKYLFKYHITTRDKLAIWGRSAGGLLIGSVLNMKPDICKVAIMGVPFVSPYLTMKTNRNPLAFESHSEWGDPRNPPYDNYIFSYSPYQNICPHGNYPNMFIYSNMNDTLVPYTEPYIYYKSLKKEVAVFRENKKDLLLHIEDKFGHIQGSSSKDKTRQYAVIFSFIDKYID